MAIQLKKVPYTTTFPKEVVEMHHHKSNEKTTLLPGGYPAFNGCDHTVIDLSHLKTRTENYQHTLSIKLPNGRHATVCVMDLMDGNCMDIAYYENGVTADKVEGLSPRVMDFKNGGMRMIENTGLIGFILDNRKVK